ncbi:uroporphyrinogen-III C-methyltransferase [Glaesserella sp.]|uniref:uroporphyrinogen-III C-methyltransferase n=1 Tax=Glaesserella sp. TaxID=2094731 RepID=UPI0035A0FCB7
MSKQGKKKETVDAVEQAVDSVDTTLPEEIGSEQAVSSSQKFANQSEESVESEVTKDIEAGTSYSKAKQEEPKQKSGGKAIAILALLVTLGIGGAGHFLTNGKFAAVEQQIGALNNQVSQIKATPPATVELPAFDAEKAQIAQLETANQQFVERISQLEREQSIYTQQINNLQSQIQKLGSSPKAEPTAWLLSDADFLLNNALRKMVLDNDIDTTRSLLIEADTVLSQVAEPAILPIRDAIKADLNQLASLNKVDQNNLMQRLAQLANLVDDMPMVDDEGQESSLQTSEVSSSIDDWQQNIEKSADSFLSHFIRISDKGSINDKVFIAPNQEIYLRENIRLRLQIAILTIPRQQNELYKQSLEAVSTWVRSYFDVQNENVKTFLNEVDDLIEQSIYIDAPNRLHSLSLLDQLLNKTPKPVSKIQIEEEKSLEQLKIEKSAETPSQETNTESAQPQAEQQSQTAQ